MSPSVPAATAPVAARLRRARFGVFGIFFVVGLGMAAWLVSIPAVQQRTGVCTRPSVCCSWCSVRVG